MGRSVAIIPARLESSRLPNKMFLYLHGYPICEWVYKRVKMSKKVDQIIFALGSNKRFLINDRESHRGESITYPHILKGAIEFKDKAIALNVERNKGLINENWVFTHIE